MARFHHHTAAVVAALLTAASLWLPAAPAPVISVAGPVTATYTLPLVA